VEEKNGVGDEHEKDKNTSQRIQAPDSLVTGRQHTPTIARNWADGESG
jgi:hypothetical protein